MPTTALHAPQPRRSLESRRYRGDYPAALKRAGIDGLDLVDGSRYSTRCTATPVARTIRPTADWSRSGAKRGGYRFYGNLAETEAFLIRLDPHASRRWLTDRGHTPSRLDLRVEQRSGRARVAILESAIVPDQARRAPPRPPSAPTCSTRSTPTRTVHPADGRIPGIERDALSEYLVPSTWASSSTPQPVVTSCSAACRRSSSPASTPCSTAFVDAEHRCPLDPGCGVGSGACTACVHLGEPSCRLLQPVPRP